MKIRHILPLLMLLAFQAAAGGLGDPHPYEDPCTVLPSESVYKAGVFGMNPEEAWQMHLILVAARCGTPEPELPLFKQLNWTDDQILHSVFNGHHVPVHPSPIPVPASFWMMLLAVGSLLIFKKRT